ncbi:MAG: tRNA (uracil-5-)-methyltransferase [Oleispira sp.]|nr:tRNA (uracil-5-)-methyltransferase [Oleispira sp.]MBL4880265.1 tRNA (uracil-5-)-methyltransferase [Oleispira sp.]
MTDSAEVLDFAQAAERRKHERREEKVTDIRDQFNRTFNPNSKPTPVKDFLRKKKAKKKR